MRRGAVGLKIKDQAGAGDVNLTGLLDKIHLECSSRSTRRRMTTSEYCRKTRHSRARALWAARTRENIRRRTARTRTSDGKCCMHQRERVLRKHPRLKLIGAHWAERPGIGRTSKRFLEKYPNMFTEGGANQPKVEFAQLDSAEQAFFERYQDQVMFGTDYMENTFEWLKSYQQRLDVFLPFTERWPLPDSVMAKYYHGNAGRLLKRASANETPVAHPGFTVTRLVGDTVVLDGTASYAAPGQALRYQWRQVEGPRVGLVDDSSARPRFVTTTVSDLAFELVVRVGPLSSRARIVRVNVIARTGQFLEADGKVVIEAEHYSSTIRRGGQAWSVARHLAGFSGSGYVVAGPKHGTIVDPGQFRARAPELRFPVWILQPGTYVVYARGAAPDTASSSVHIGLDNEEVRLADRVGRFPVGRWGWARDAFEWDVQFQMTDTTLAVLDIPEPGPHVLNVWMHRDGVMLDRVMLVRAPYAEVAKPLFDPGVSAGPAESRRRAASRRVSGR